MKSNIVIICLVSLILWEFNIFNLKQKPYSNSSEQYKLVFRISE